MGRTSRAGDGRTTNAALRAILTVPFSLSFTFGLRPEVSILGNNDANDRTDDTVLVALRFVGDRVGVLPIFPAVVDDVFDSIVNAQRDPVATWSE